MSTQALIERDSARLTVAWTPHAMEMRREALEASALICRVENEEDQARVVEAMRTLKAVESDAEKARKVCKEPIIEFGRNIDASARAFVEPIKEELMRLAKPLGDFVALQEAKRKAAEAERLQELADLERRRQAELAKATSHEELDRVQEKYNNQAAALPTPTVERPKGQIVREEWDIVVTDVWALVRSHPMCVKVEPRLQEIRDLLNAGVKVAGVRAERVTKATVRASRAPLTLELQ